LILILSVFGIIFTPLIKQMNTSYSIFIADDKFRPNKEIIVFIFSMYCGLFLICSCIFIEKKSWTIAQVEEIGILLFVAFAIISIGFVVLSKFGFSPFNL